MALSELAANAAADAVCGLLDGGTLYIQNSAGGVLADLTYGSPAFASASGGKCAGLPLEPELDAPVRGKPAKFVACGSDGKIVFTGAVGAELTLNVDVILKHTEVRVTSHYYKQPME